jgi:hypothetical protein
VIASIQYSGDKQQRARQSNSTTDRRIPTTGSHTHKREPTQKSVNKINRLSPRDTASNNEKKLCSRKIEAEVDDG